MTQSAITLAFGDGEYTFRLGIAQIEELQRKCGVGIGGLCARLLKGRYQIAGLPIGTPNEAEFFLADVVEPIRQGLIGGNEGVVDGVQIAVSTVRANQLIEAYVLPPRPLADAWTLSAAIVGALIAGYSPPKKAEPPVAAAPKTRRAKKAGSTMPEPLSTAP